MAGGDPRFVCLIEADRKTGSQWAFDMTLDPTECSGPEYPTPDTNELLSVALDAYLAGHERVAQDLAALASHLVETNGCSRLSAVAREILARANAPGQDFVTLLQPFDLGLTVGRIPAEQIPDRD